MAKILALQAQKEKNCLNFPAPAITNGTFTR
jgi:hypothetical protein